MKKYEFDKLPVNEKFITLRGLAYWAKVHKPETNKYKSTSYNLSLAIHTPEALALCKKFGLALKEPNDTIKHPYLQLKRTIKNPNDAAEVAKKRIIVVDTAQKEVPETILIGNGSDVDVKVSLYWSETTERVMATPSKMRVRKLVPYAARKEFEDVEDGFIAEEDPAPFSFEQGDDLPFLDA